jgi:hypothetical protein
VERSNWLVEHFWDNFDFKQKSVGQQQLNHAFNTWCLPMRFANKDVALNATNSLIKKIEKNPTLLLQFTMAAEYNVYQPATAEVWIDELYLPFLQAIEKNKKVPATYKARYASQYKVLSGSLKGGPMPKFLYDDQSGVKRAFNSIGIYSLVEFGDPTCSDCQLLRIQIKSSEFLTSLVESGKLKIYFIIPDADSADADWREQVADYPGNWICGASHDLDETIDLRLVPSLYLINPSGVISLKNTNIDEVLKELESVEAPAAEVNIEDVSNK